ncbi:hypothetical protein NS226_13880 [Aureimonas ureilytica]|uniref:ATP-dependent Clp protease proteolytic subunit n=1 Tax=Aureimonas ureilytica TaxID=401562 RepID=A0A175R8V9_9HYPH|nr:head maturation protease, ClpP-related [Aureimonas ureilytica]KTQ95016.1 hypothetical protein NS226_13880 [Aureimonas ureilytica]
MDIYRDGALYLYGVVGESYWDEGFTASQVLLALAEHGRDQDITVHINSGGGVVDDGIAVYNALASHKGHVRVEIDAVALSSASLIAMAGDTVVMRAGALMMIHDPSTITIGPADAHARTIEQLDAYATQMAAIYAERSGKTVDEARSDMKAEIWLTSTQAVEQGYADEAEAAKAKAVAAFDYRVYAKAPKELHVTARKKGWSMNEPGSKPTATATTPSNKQEPPMGDKPNGGEAPDNTAVIAAAVKADRERRRSILALEEAKGRETLAAYFADETEDAIEKVKAALAAAPKASADPAKPQGAADASAALHEQRRLNGEGLGGGDGPKAKSDKSILASAADSRNKRR